MDGFQKPLDSGERKAVGMPIVRYGSTDQGREFAYCSCGKPFTQAREKVREDAIDKHFKKRHGNRGIRL